LTLKAHISILKPQVRRECGMKCPKCQSDNPDTLKFCGECGTQLLSAEEAQASQTKTLETPVEELTRGTLFAERYEIIEELGRGGMGKVYRVEDTSIKQEVALKLIKPEIASDKKTIERFGNELKNARMISHRNVCRMFDLGKDKGAHYITMEYVPGEDLKSFIRRSGQLAVGTTIKIAKQVCEGLAEAHRVGVIHRDLKSNNIMIDKEGNARIMDFGIARSLKSKGLTGSGVMIGTPEYMSPEQVEGKDVDQRSDIYSLGVILYEMVTGSVPFVGDTPFTIGVKHKSEIPKSPKELNSNLPGDLNHVILKCLEKEKEKRYLSAGELRSELESIEKGIPTTEREAEERKPLTSREITVQLSPKKLLIPALVIIAIAVIGLILWSPWAKKEATAAQKIENSIAIINFENLTGDESNDVFQKSIPNLLITHLENSGDFYVVTWERLHDLVKQMGKEDVDFVNSDIGFELCRREGVEALITGSLNKAGSVFATDVKVYDVETKTLLKSTTSQGEGIDSIIRTQIDELSKEISKGLKLSERSVEIPEGGISDYTTSSMEAYNYFIRGYEEAEKFYYEDARKFYEKALEFDPDFAAVHSGLGYIYGSLNSLEKRDASIRKAMALSKNATEKERLRIEAHYELIIGGDNEKRLRILEEFARKYPREKNAHRILGNYYQIRDRNRALEEYNIALELDPYYGPVLNHLGYMHIETEDFEKALEYFERFAASSPGDANPIDSIGDLHFKMGDLDKAITKFQEAIEVKPDFFNSYWNIGYMYALKEDYKEAISWIDRGFDIAPSLGVKGEGFVWKGFYHYLLGKYEQALINFRDASELFDKAESEFYKNSMLWWNGFLYLSKGMFETGRAQFEVWKSHMDKSDPETPWIQINQEFYFGLVDLEQGQVNSARSRLKEINAILPKNRTYKSWITFLYSLLYGEILLAEGNLDECISYCEKELKSKIPNWNLVVILGHNIPFMRDVLARAYKEKGEIEKAITEYERLITFDPDSRDRLLVHPKNYYRLAMLYEQQGNSAKAVEFYEKFLTLWKDADPGIAEVEDAKDRLAKLQQ
jgi:serine/threonine protein kinase/tetratricopeptide (TPR) repeat protein